MSINITVKFIEEKHKICFTFLNTRIIQNENSPYKAKFIQTNLLLSNGTFFYFDIEKVKGIKYKYELRKYVKNLWGIKTKYLKNIKHLNTINNCHNYIIYLEEIPKELMIYNNKVSSLDKITWRSFFEIQKINKPLSEIYLDMSKNGFETQFKLEKNNLQLSDIYGNISNSFD